MQACKRNNIGDIDKDFVIKPAKKNNIRVYPIDVVKGMEFDVVFFHNIDKVIADPDLVKRFIYVGVSRAAFFLGVTMSKEMPEIGKYLQKNKKWDKI